jgi:hypothetical protein
MCHPPISFLVGLDLHAWAAVKRTNHLLIGADILFANDTAKRPNPNTDSVGELLDSGCQRCKGCGTWLRWARTCQLRHRPHQVGRHGNQDWTDRTGNGVALRGDTTASPPAHPAETCQLAGWPAAAERRRVHPAHRPGTRLGLQNRPQRSRGRPAPGLLAPSASPDATGVVSRPSTPELSAGRSPRPTALPGARPTRLPRRCQSGASGRVRHRSTGCA